MPVPISKEPQTQLCTLLWIALLQDLPSSAEQTLEFKENLGYLERALTPT